MGYRIFRKLLTVEFSALLAGLLIFPLADIQAQEGTVQIAPSHPGFTLPPPGQMLQFSPKFTPATLRGITVNPANPFNLSFVLENGESGLQGDALKDESQKLIKYFLVSLTIPENDIWVNLSPYEKDRITTEILGQTEMGRNLLEEDYVLKQLVASITYPEAELGKAFWDRVYAKVKQQFGTQNIQVNTFNKVWIIPQKVHLYVNDNMAYIVSSHLNVMLEEDYLALKNNLDNAKTVSGQMTDKQLQDPNSISSSVVREILIPEIEREVNEGKNFAPLRQVFNSLILATWYKMHLKDSLLSKVYVNQNKVKGVDTDDKDFKQKIYAQYLEAFQKGVYSYIKEDYDPAVKASVPKKYFSGGIFGKVTLDVDKDLPSVMQINGQQFELEADLSPQIKPTADASMLSGQDVAMPFWRVDALIGPAEKDIGIVQSFVDEEIREGGMTKKAAAALRDFILGKIDIKKAEKILWDPDNPHYDSEVEVRVTLLAHRVAVKNKMGYRGVSFLRGFNSRIRVSDARALMQSLQEEFFPGQYSMEILWQRVVEFYLMKNIIGYSELNLQTPWPVLVGAYLDANFLLNGQAVSPVVRYLMTDDSGEKKKIMEELGLLDSRQRAAYIFSAADYLMKEQKSTEGIVVNISHRFLDIFGLEIRVGPIAFGDRQALKEILGDQAEKLNLFLIFDYAETLAVEYDAEVYAKLTEQDKMNLRLFPLAHPANKNFYEKFFKGMVTQRARIFRVLLRDTLQDEPWAEGKIDQIIAVLTGIAYPQADQEAAQREEGLPAIIHKVVVDIPFLRKPDNTEIDFYALYQSALKEVNVEYFPEILFWESVYQTDRGVNDAAVSRLLKKPDFMREVRQRFSESLQSRLDKISIAGNERKARLIEIVSGAFPYFANEQIKIGDVIFKAQEEKSGNPSIPPAIDQAMLASATGGKSTRSAPVETAARTKNDKEVGGIDFNPNKIQFQIDEKQQNIPFLAPSSAVLKDLEILPIEGFVPIIINITPIPNLTMHLSARK